MIGNQCSTWVWSINCYLSNVPILPLGGKFKMWTFFKQHQFLPDVRIFIIKYYFIPTLVSSRKFLEFPHFEYVSFLRSSTYLHTLVFMACLLFEWLMAKFIGWSVHQKIYDHCPKDSLLTTLFLVKEFFPLIGFQRCCSVLLSDLLLTVATFISSMEQSSFF